MHVCSGALAFLVVVVGATSCAKEQSTSALGAVTIGVRQGERDAVQPIDEIAAGSRQDLAAMLEVRRPTGWVVATWRHWPASDGPPKVLGTKQFNTTATGTKPLFTHLAGDTSFGGWMPGAVTCDFTTADGEARAGRLAVSRR